MALFRLVAASRSHLAGVGEAYFEHMRFAFGVGAMMVSAGIACMLHALIPGLCQDTASRTLAQLTRSVEDREALGEALAETAEAIGFAMLLSMGVSFTAALWLLGADAAIAVPITLLSLAFPAAVLAANPNLRAAPRPAATIAATGPFSPIG